MFSYPQVNNDLVAKIQKCLFVHKQRPYPGRLGQFEHVGKHASIEPTTPVYGIGHFL